MKKNEPKATLNFDISQELEKQVKDEAKRLQISKAGFVRMRLIEYFNKERN